MRQRLFFIRLVRYSIKGRCGVSLWVSAHGAKPKGFACGIMFSKKGGGVLEKVKKAVLNHYVERSTIGVETVFRFDEVDNFLEFAMLSIDVIPVIEELMREGFFKIVDKNANGKPISFSLTYKALHAKEYKKIALVEYLRNEWIAIAALIISVIALIRSW